MKITRNDLNINIQAHKKRKGYIPYLKSKLGDVAVIWDKYDDVWETRERCLQQHLQMNKKYSLTIQDDCLITDEFITKVLKILNRFEKRRHYAYNFYFWNTSLQQVLRARRRGYYRKIGMKSGLAICLPTDVIEDLLKFWAGKDELKKHDDSRIGIFLRNRRIRTIYPCPSLIQHRNSPSIIYKNGEMPDDRQSICYEEK